MTTILVFLRFSIAVGLGVALVACAQLDVAGTPSGPATSPQQPGAAAGTEPVSELSADQAARLNHLMKPLIGKMNRPIPPDEVKVTVLKDAGINAANGGGGDFYVTLGLLQKAGDDELRAILAHEIAHADLGHIDKIQTVSAGVAIGTTLLGTIWPESGQLAPVAGQLLLSRYSQTEESAADAHAVTIMRRAGYDGKTLMVNALVWLTKTSGGSSGGFFATHPATDTRIQDLRAMK
jgi:predicted Zn-dependent protease